MHFRVVQVTKSLQDPLENAARVCRNVQFDTICAFLILICALLTAHLSVGANSAPLGLPAGFWGRERRGKGRGKENERGKKLGGEKRKREEGKEKGIKERRGEKKGKERKGRREGEGRNFVQL